jgi:hypothetical protein
MEHLVEYIIQNFGLDAKVWSMGKDDIDRLPLYLKGNIELFKGQIGGKDLLWAKVREGVKDTPDWLQNQGEQLKKIFHIPVVFVFDRLESWQRKRLIEKNVGFVQLYKQLYIPEMLVQLSDVPNRGLPSEKLDETLSFPAQYAILYHLQKENPFRLTAFQEISKILGYSPMTITRVARELHNLKLATIPKTKPQAIDFPLGKDDLWDRALPYLHSPIKEIWFSEEDFATLGFLEAGNTALARYTMLSDVSEKTYAVGKKRFRSLQNSGELPSLNKKYGDYRLEVWQYDPTILADNDSETVDKISLFLSMQDQQDERVRAALNELLVKIEW